MAVSKIAYLTYQGFCFNLLRQFAASFCLWTKEGTNTSDTILPNIVLSVLYFFSIVFNFVNFYSTKSKLFFFLYILWNLIYILFWKYYISRKTHIWLIRKGLIIMLKNRLIFWITLYALSYLINHIRLIIYCILAFRETLFLRGFVLKPTKRA